MSFIPIEETSIDRDAKRLILLSGEDAEIVFGLVENPPEPNDRLKSAARKHRDFFGEKNTAFRAE